MENSTLFKSIELLEKQPNGSVVKIKFDYVRIMITGNYLIINKNQADGDVLLSETNEIFNLSTIKAYKTIL